MCGSFVFVSLPCGVLLKFCIILKLVFICIQKFVLVCVSVIVVHVRLRWFCVSLAFVA